MVSGALTKDRASATPPEARGYTGALSQGLYWFGFEISNVVVFGTRR